jgi:hypothetical protein
VMAWILARQGCGCGSRRLGWTATSYGRDIWQALDRRLAGAVSPMSHRGGDMHCNATHHTETGQRLSRRSRDPTDNRLTAA